MKFVQNRDGGTGGSAGDQGQVNHPFKAITLNFLINATQATSVTTTLFGGMYLPDNYNVQGCIYRRGLREPGPSIFFLISIAKTYVGPSIFQVTLKSEIVGPPSILKA